MAAESGDEYDDDFEIESPSGHGWKDIDFADVELRDKIGGGGFAIVYAGEWRGRPCAVKTLFDPKVDEALKQEYMDELHVMRDLKHRNIVKFLGACTKPPKLCFIMELCSSSLFGLLHQTRRPLSQAELVRMATDVASGLAHLHSQKPPIIHRDIKSHNSLIADDGTVKLCDFGLVSNRNNTAGTPAYMAPELLAGGMFSRKVDNYAFGVLLWEMFAREIPFHGWRPADVRDAVVRGERPPLKGKDLPSTISRIVRECWDADPDKRPEMADVATRLRSWKPRVSAVTSLAGSGGDSLDALLK